MPETVNAGLHSLCTSAMVCAIWYSPITANGSAFMGRRTLSDALKAFTSSVSRSGWVSITTMS